MAILAMPIIIFRGGAWVMSKMTNRQYVTSVLCRKAAPADRRPLNRRLGYDLSAVNRHWGALDDTAINIEQRFLQLDLVFPVLYGTAFAASLLMAWAMLGRPFHLAWIIVPVAVIVLSDWTENLVQLGQLRRFLDGDETALQASWIHIASAATTLKLLFFVGSSVFLVGLVIAVVVGAR